MKISMLILTPALIGMIACQNVSKQSTTKDSTVTENIPVTGYYEASMPAASSPGRIIGLTLSEGNDVTMTTDYMNMTPEIVQRGNWMDHGGGKIMLSLVTVGSGNPAKDTLNFRRDGNSLIYEGSDYGSDGLTLTRKDAPVPQDKELLVWINGETTCKGAMGEDITCYEVCYGDKFMEPADGNWDKLSGSIEGFTYQKGNRYKLKVNRKVRKPAPADASMYEYVLVEQVSKVKK
ncbi:hypothetical protein COR50_05010 [Chitinophaga caeni]|uniref:DUF4377 domain-containing protein n=1 Tax=Chitinophaga caeni TaxID=2029983 RepID=A0A291QRK5_9BACT|nr:DUF4377 domain-containing protein [Chitinophaga caeni]ATL46590.1 hypothetical protein COR50_05010 [Chitinophaga caeni]